MSDTEVKTELPPDTVQVKEEVHPDVIDGEGGDTCLSVAGAIQADVAMVIGGGNAIWGGAQRGRGRPSSNLPKPEKGPRGRKRLNHTGMSDYEWRKAGRPMNTES